MSVWVYPSSPPPQKITITNGSFILSVRLNFIELFIYIRINIFIFVKVTFVTSGHFQLFVDSSNYEETNTQTGCIYKSVRII